MNLLHRLGAEAAFDPVLQSSRREADGILLGICAFLQWIGLVSAVLSGAWVGPLLVGLPSLALAAWLAHRHGGTLVTRIAIAAALAAAAALRICQSHGETEAHATVLALVGLLLFYRDWRAIAAAAFFLVVHQALLGWLRLRGLSMPGAGTPPATASTALPLQSFYLLPALAAIGCLAVRLRREAFASRSVIDLARRIVQGDIGACVTGERGPVPFSELLDAVLAMRNRLLELLHAMPVPMVLVREDTDTIVHVNHAFTQLFGLDRRDCRGLGVDALPVWQDPADWRGDGPRPRGGSDPGSPREVRMRAAGGRPLVCELTLLRHDAAEPHMTILAVVDVTLRREAEQRLRHLALHDPLTGLPNRAALRRYLVESVRPSSRHRRGFAVALVDLDGFKLVNDRHGHQAGDAVLVEVARRLAGAIGGDDRACRLGGDEFVLLLADGGDDAALCSRGQQVLDAVGAPLALADGTRVRIGASIGLTRARDGDETDLDEPLRRADLAMYRAKAAGRNRIALYDRADERRARPRDFRPAPAAASADRPASW